MTNETPDKYADAKREAALYWQIRLASGEASEADYEAFCAWLEEDAGAFSTFAEAERLAAAVERDKRLAGQFRPAVAEFRKGGVFNRYSNWRIAAALAATLALAVFAGLRIVAPARPDLYAEAAKDSSVRTVSLSDGSTVTLAPGSSFSAKITGKRREVDSIEGRAVFDVARDPGRPFTVAVGENTVRVLGTKFEVASLGGVQSVAVLRGHVEVSNSKRGEPAETYSLLPGDLLQLKSNSPGSVSKVEVGNIADWQSGFFDFAAASFPTVADRLNAFYGKTAFSVSSNAREIQFSGILKLGTPEDVARRLSDLSPVSVTPAPSGRF
ncbi:MAG: FecR domain-containing protein [Parvularculaceae bacterium]